MMILALLLFLTVSFLLSGIESAILSVSRVRVRHAANEGDARARKLLPLLEDRDALLGCITVANHVTNLVSFLILAWYVLGVSDFWSYVIAFVLSLPVFLVGIEVIPKKLFRRFPFRSLRHLTPLVRFVGLFRPVFRAITLPVLGDRQEAPSHSVSRDDLANLASILCARDQLSPSATGLIHRIIKYKSLTTADLMLPLNHSIAVASDVPLATALILARENNVSTLPVLSDSGDFVGLLEMDSLPANIPNDRQVRQHMRVLEHVRASDSALRSVQSLRRKGREVAVVLNADRQPVGLASTHDLIAPLLRQRDAA